MIELITLLIAIAIILILYKIKKLVEINLLAFYF